VHKIIPCFLITLSCLSGYNTHAQGKIVQKNTPDTVPAHVDSLKAAIVTAAMRPKMKGDTLEYNTEHVDLHRSAAVEELLKRLPGLHIDPDGTIIYNGEKIQHLLVDGEDIFGSDPAMVTRSFNASKIARVQILDRRSEQASFTGIDDGARTKTLNLVLKESAKDGYFGKVEGGGNSDGCYNANAALAAFRNREQFTALGIAANNGDVGFSNSKSGAAVSLMNAIVSADALGASAGLGIPRFDAAALHYANTWPGAINHLVANYQFSHYYSQPITSTQMLQAQPGNVYGQHQLSQSINQQYQHWFYGIYDWAPNTTSAFKINFHYSNSDGVNRFGAAGSSSFNDTLVNTSLRTIRDMVNRINIGGGASWRIQVGKSTNSVFSASADVTKIDASTSGYIYSLNQFYQSNRPIQPRDTVDQRKEINSHNLNVSSSVGYTKPLWKGTALGLAYTISYIVDDPLQATYNRGEGKYLEIVDSLSSHIKTQDVRHQTTANLRGKVGCFSYTIGGDWLGYSYSQWDLNSTASTLHLNYSKLAPRILLYFTPNKTTNFGFSYAASSGQLFPTQLTPIKNNIDPLHVTLGNPDLKPEFSQNFKFEFRRIKTWLTYFSVKIGGTSNSIGSKTITDSLGRQISQSVNINGARSDEINLSLSRKLLNFNVWFHTSGTYTRTMNFLNTALNVNNAYMAGGGLDIGKYLADGYSFQLGTNFAYFDQINSVNVAAPIRYWSQTYSGNVSVFLIKGFEVNTNFSYTWQQKSSAFATSTSVLLWNTYVSRNLFHDKLVGKFQFNNVLNASAGISRSNMGNVNTQSSTNIRGRYWMFSMSYIFDKKFRRK